VCVCERERERECVCERERDSKIYDNGKSVDVDIVR
jgi:hypothetical protein